MVGRVYLPSEGPVKAVKIIWRLAIECVQHG